MTIVHHRRGPHIALECSLPSEVTAISPFVDKLMPLLRNCGCVSEGENDVEVALREALAGTDYKAIRAFGDVLNQATMPLAERIMNRALSTALEGKQLGEV